MGLRPHQVYPGTGPARSVVVSVPHAGREYSEATLRRARLSPDRMRRLEDRHADRLTDDLVEAGYPTIIARTPRALIDLNRDERDIDSRIVTDIPYAQPLIQSAKQRGGLGLFPRSIPGEGDIWAGAIEWSEAEERIAFAHRPYHEALSGLMDDAVAAHGCAVVLDVHSMPPVRPDRSGIEPPDIVIGDRFGTSAASWLSAAAQSVAAAFGWKVSLNHPYPGSYLLERHGRPKLGRHALQIEVSRDLYLDSEHRDIAGGLGRVQDMLLAMADLLAEELSGASWAWAAE